mgnify:CR=1 FL=1
MASFLVSRWQGIVLGQIDVFLIRHEEEFDLERSTPLAEAHHAWVTAQIDRRSQAQLEPIELEYLPWGPPLASTGELCDMVASFGEGPLEYAAMRKGCAILDGSRRGTLELRGEDRLDFLDRMVTNLVKDLRPGQSRDAFFLTRKGRIESDLGLLVLEDRILIDLDIHNAPSTTAALDAFIIVDDVALTDISDQMHHISLFGPKSIHTLELASGEQALGMDSGAVRPLNIGNGSVIARRQDLTGEVGFELLVERDHAATVYNALLATDEDPEPGKRTVRPVGWHAFNIARVESGLPIFNIDFGVTNLPHETGLLEQRVSFQKGCYPGQEIVARMQNLGKPKQQMVILQIHGDQLPLAGAAVVRSNQEESAQIGVVTSSVLSPLNSLKPRALAMLRTAAIEEDRACGVVADGGIVSAEVQDL